MEKFALTLQSKHAVIEYLAEQRLMRYERAIMIEIQSVIERGDGEQLAWFAGFGDSFRQILMNVNDYRRGLEFGFTEIAFNQYGWLASPKFLDFEEIKLEKSSIRIGRGPNGMWAYALSCDYGTAGSSSPLCVFCKQFKNRDEVMNAALSDLKDDMTKYIGNTDTLNYKHDVISKTLKAISGFEVSMVQLTLF